MAVAMMRCASCGAVLSGTDRYCPACDAPNTAKLFPKFRPHLTDLRDDHELSELSVAAAPGELRCPRCAAVLRVGDAFCSVCGLDTERVFVRAGREPWVGLWPTPGPHNLDPYRSLRPWSVTLRTMLMVMMVVAAALAALQVAQFDSVGTMPWRRGFGLPRTAAFIDILETILVGLALLLVLLAVGWTNRAYRNLPAMSVTGLRFSPEIAAAAWVVPGINIVIPKLILDELWKGSDPDAAPRSTAWRAQRAPVLSLVAWVLLVIGTALAIIVWVSMPDPTAVTLLDLQFSFALAATAYGLIALGGLLFCMLVGQISERQELRAERLGPPAVLKIFAGSELESVDARCDRLIEFTLSNLHRANSGPVWGRY